MSNWQAGEYCEARDTVTNQNCATVGYTGRVNYVHGLTISFSISKPGRQIEAYCSQEQFANNFRGGLNMGINKAYIGSKHHRRKYPDDFFINKPR